MNDAVLRSAFQHHQAGNAAEAARLYGEVLRSDPAQPDALCMLGLLRAQQGDAAEAGRLADMAAGVRQASPAALYNLGYLLQQLGRHRDALAIYDRAIAAKPNYFEALVHRGVSHFALKEYPHALTAYDAALKIRPNEAGLWNNRGNALVGLGRVEEAIEAYDRAVALKPGFSESWENRGNAALSAGRYDEAVANYDAALTTRQGSAALWFNRGLAESRRKRHREATSSFDTALKLDPLSAPALFQRGNALCEAGRPQDALADFDASLAIDPANVDAQVSRGVALAALGRSDDALAVYDAVLDAKPDCIEALANRGSLRFEHRQFEGAVRDYEAALALFPDFPYLRGNLALYRMSCCDWRSFEDDRMHIAAGLMAGKPVILPFANLTISDSPADQWQCARLWTMRECPPSAEPLWRGERYGHDRIRVAYLSADFHMHATAFLTAGVFEQHDKSRFETVAISYGPDDGSAMRDRLRVAFDQFIDVRGKSDSEIAGLLRQMEIDIAVDLKGYTQNSRPGILAHRPAPVQVHYLGYPGTIGSETIDYIIADKTVIPEKHRLYFSEKIAYLPNSYQCNDSQRPIAATRPAREAVGLAPHAFVFASFNNSFKLAPGVFAVWMRLLRANGDAVLWLLEYSAAATANLKAAAVAAGVDPARLVFADPRPHSEHLARLALADLFLDTLPYNAHTTASDALWAGLPVLTVLGSAFAGRVGTSLLRASGLPELVCESLDAYEAMALRLSRDKAQLAVLRTRLADNRDTCALFDTQRFTRHLEAALIHMHERAASGLPPESFEAAP